MINTNIPNLLNRNKTQNKPQNSQMLGHKNLFEREIINELNDNSQQILSYSNNENINLQEDQLYTYYCSLCGANVIVSDTMLESMPRRKTDESVIVLVNKIFFKNYMRRDRLVVIKRECNKYEKQYRFCCQDCGVFIAYQSRDYDEQDTQDELKKRSNKIFSQDKRKILYIMIDAVVVDPRQSSLYIEMEKIKDNINKKPVKKHRNDD
jgi:hypothetical protein